MIYNTYINLQYGTDFDSEPNFSVFLDDIFDVYVHTFKNPALKVTRILFALVWPSWSELVLRTRRLPRSWTAGPYGIGFRSMCIVCI